MKRVLLYIVYLAICNYTFCQEVSQKAILANKIKKIEVFSKLDSSKHSFEYDKNGFIISELITPHFAFGKHSFEQITYSYKNFNLTKKETKVCRADTILISSEINYEYDSDNRLLNEFHKQNKFPENILLVQYNYLSRYNSPICYKKFYTLDSSSYGFEIPKTKFSDGRNYYLSRYKVYNAYNFDSATIIKSFDKCFEKSTSEISGFCSSTIEKIIPLGKQCVNKIILNGNGDVLTTQILFKQDDKDISFYKKDFDKTYGDVILERKYTYNLQGLILKIENQIERTGFSASLNNIEYNYKYEFY